MRRPGTDYNVWALDNLKQLTRALRVRIISA